MDTRHRTLSGVDRSTLRQIAGAVPGGALDIRAIDRFLAHLPVRDLTRVTVADACRRLGLEHLLPPAPRHRNFSASEANKFLDGEGAQIRLDGVFAPRGRR